MAEKGVKLFSNNFMAGAFAVLNFALVLLLMWTVSTEYAPEWKEYQRDYFRLLAERTDDPGLKKKILSEPYVIRQTWNPKLQIIDRCTTCHMGVENPLMADAPQPFATHPGFEGQGKVPPQYEGFNRHLFSQIGCTACHEGQGVATTQHAAHVMEDLDERFSTFDAQHAGWERPLLPLEYIHASCQKCHNVMEGPIPGANHLNTGWQLVQEKGCKTCHYIVDSGAKQAPELSEVGSKFYNGSGHSEVFQHVRFGYLQESLRCPQANMDHEAAEACQATLAPATAMAPGATLSGEELVKQYQCTNCHSLDTPQKLIGPSLYDVGKRQDKAYIRESILEPDKVVVTGFPAGLMKGTLSGVGFYNDVQQNPAITDALVTYLTSLQGGTEGQDHAETAPAAPVVVMPNFGFNDAELRDVVTFLLSLQGPTVSWPQKSFAQESANAKPAATGPALIGESGAELVNAAGCNACHKFDGPERLVGPSLWDIGAKKDKTYIRESILEPDKVVAAGYPPGVMKSTLAGTGFYQKVSLEALEQIVDYLADLKGKL